MRITKYTTIGIIHYTSTLTTSLRFPYGAYERLNLLESYYLDQCE